MKKFALILVIANAQYLINGGAEAVDPLPPLDPNDCRTVTLISGNQAVFGGSDWKASYYYTKCGNKAARRGETKNRGEFSLMYGGSPQIKVVKGTPFFIGPILTTINYAQDLGVERDITIICRGNVLKHQEGISPECKIMQ